MAKDEKCKGKPEIDWDELYEQLSPYAQKYGDELLTDLVYGWLTGGYTSPAREPVANRESDTVSRTVGIAFDQPDRWS